MSIKIYLSYHDRHKLLKSDVLTPIQTGCAVAEELFEGMLRDDLGENISTENDKYNELTAQYWVWKNYEAAGNPEYVGFMHYRRHFVFDDCEENPKAVWLPGGHIYHVPWVTPTYMKHVRDELIMQRVAGQDCVALKPYDVRNLGRQTVREQYTCIPGQQGEWFDLLLEAVRRLYPDYAAAADKLEQSSVQYLCNMFIMRRELFFEYSEFCFRILAEVDRQVDSTQLRAAAKRFLGYLGEFCLTLYLFHIQERDKAKILELNGAYLLSDEVIKPTLGRLFFYRLMSKITFGKRRRTYKAKKKQIAQLRELEKLSTLPQQTH